MWKRLVVALGLVFVVFLAGRAHADDESDRNDLLQQIDEKVRAIADKLDGFVSDSDASDLDTAISDADDVKDLVSRLDSVKGDDSHANDVVSSYPGYVDTFKDAAQYLRRMKQHQRLGDGVADRCASDEADLQQLIRQYVGNPDAAEDGPAKLVEKGQQLGRTWTELVAKMQSNDQDMASNASSARLSLSADAWSSVSDKLDDASAAIASYWSERYKAIQSACTRIALGEHHPDIEKALQTLADHTSSVKATVKQLKHDYNAWLSDVRKMRQLSQQDRDELRETMCRTGGEYDMEQKVDEIADRWASSISSVYGTTLGVADQLKARATDSKLAKYKGAKQVLDGIAANLANLEKLKNYELQGANNPKIRTKLEYGKDKHAELQSSLCSDGYAEADIEHCSNSIRPGSGCRADCVLPGSTCMVIEIKPDSDDAKQEGDSQRAAYADGLRSWYEQDKKGLFDAYPKLQQCENSDHDAIAVDSRLEVYKFCPDSSDELTQQPMAEVSGDLSESE